MFLIGHFTASFVYCMPDRFFPNVLNIWSKKYINPAFNQGWTMFAPNPPLKEKWMEYRWAENGEWNNWHRADTIFQDEFHRYRVTHHLKMQHIVQNSAAHLWGEAWKSGQMANQFFEEYEGDSIAYLRDSFGYTTCMHLTEGLLKSQHVIDINNVDSLDIRLILKDPYVEEGKTEMDTIIYEFPAKLLER